MTRSIGDWFGADAVLPHPQLSSFTVPPGKHYRLLIASDGLWDVCEARGGSRR